MTAACKYGDQDTISLMSKIAKVPSSVKDAVTLFYIKKCCELQAIAFFQWRLKYPTNSESTLAELQEIILSRFNNFYVDENFNHFVSAETFENSEVPEGLADFYKKYDLQIQENANFCI